MTGAIGKTSGAATTRLVSGPVYVKIGVFTAGAPGAVAVGTKAPATVVIKPGAGTVTNKLDGEIWLRSDGERADLGLEQVRLLEVVGRTGSISAAARQLGISYKTAWERIERLNNLAREPVVIRAAGGSQGGGSQLTEYGKRIVAGYASLSREHDEFIDRLGARLARLDDLAGFVRSSRVRSSVGNQFLGTVSRINPGAVNAEVSLALSDDLTLAAVITAESLTELDLKTGDLLLAMVMPGAIILSTTPDIQVSARNRLGGHIARINAGIVNSEVVLDIGQGKTLNVVVTNESVQRMALREGMSLCAFFKASAVVLMRI